MISCVSSVDLASILGVSSIKSNIKLVDALATPERDAIILYSIAKTLTPKFVLEIGTFYGHTTYGLAVNSPKSTIYTIDICKEMGIGVPSYQAIERLPKNEVGKRFKNSNLKIVQIFGDSRNSSIYKEPPDFDFVYIDGNHSAGSIISDTENVFNKTTKNALIFWHDYKDDGLVETKSALKQIINKFGINIWHIRDSWLAFTMKTTECGFCTEQRAAH